MLESKKVFIDTQYYIQKGLDFDYPALSSFRDLCKQDKLINFTTSVVRQEVYGKIKDSTTVALGIIKDFKRKRHILTAINQNFNCSVFDDINHDVIYEQANISFDNFLKECSTTIVDSSEINAEDLLELYFNQSPPFSEKKKKEFPDAISLLSLKSHLDTDEKIYVVSDDPDMNEFCKTDTQMISVESLEKVLDLYNQHDENITIKIKEYISEHDSQIKEKIESILKDTEIYNNSTWEDSEINDFHITGIGTINPNIINIKDDGCLTMFDIDIEFEIHASGPDYINSSIYDKEDGKLYVFDTVERIEYIDKTFTVEIEFIYEIEDSTLKEIEIDSLDIANISSGIEVDVDESPDYYV
ncbi:MULTISPECIES: PIN domain-containing protein [unclassified Sulfurimonas]|uniref:PIN domain-containing protein n=1 Tax=unclassified Sulfurimonas TaxID=2623549 RepID=UPI0025F148C1|nr:MULTISPECIES: PIN domain-containing protein [unclassified Sulfurimonas]